MTIAAAGTMNLIINLMTFGLPSGPFFDSPPMRLIMIEEIYIPPAITDCDGTVIDGSIYACAVHGDDPVNSDGFGLPVGISKLEVQRFTLSLSIVAGNYRYEGV